MKLFSVVLLSTIIGATSMLLSGCQSYAEDPKVSAWNLFKIDLCDSKPAKWTPALKKLFTLVEQEDPKGIQLFLEIDRLGGGSTYAYSEELRWYHSRLYQDYRPTPGIAVLGKKYDCGRKCAGNKIVGYYCPRHREYLLSVSPGVWDKVREKLYDLARANVPFATREVAKHCQDAFRIHDYYNSYESVYCIKSKNLCRWIFTLVDNKSEGALYALSTLVRHVGNSKFENRGISSGWGDSSFDGLPGFSSYIEKFFKDYAEKGDSQALAYLYEFLTEKPDIGEWQYHNRGLEILKKLAISGKADAIKYLVQIMKTKGKNSFPALKILIEVQKVNPSPVIHNVIMEEKEKTTEEKIYGYIDKNYQ